MAEPLLLAQLVERGLRSSDLGDFSTNLQAKKMNFHCKEFSWVFTLRKQNGITVDHVLEFIHAELREPIREGEMDGRRLRAAYEERVRRSKGQVLDHLDKHIQRIDFLERKTLFVGLHPLPEQGPSDWLMVFHYPHRR
jgi:hypothetical protein